MVLMQTVGIFAVTGILGTTRGLHVGRTPGLRPQGAQESGRVRGAGTNFNIDRLQKRAALFVPIVLQAQDHFLKSKHKKIDQKCEPAGKSRPRAPTTESMTENSALVS